MRPDRLIWAPRAVAIAFILFLSLFSLDVFFGEASFAAKLAGFLVHNIPSIIVTLFLCISWRRPGIGACAFIVVAVVLTVFFKTYRDWASFAIITFPLVLVSGLFAWTLVRSRGATL